MCYRLDFNNHTATKWKEFIPEPSVFIDGMGSADWNNDTLLLNFGSVFRPAPSLQLVAGNQVLRT